MRGKVTYIYHSCFLLRIENVCFLFDYPEKAHLPKGSDKIVLDNVKAEDTLYVFFSHGHEDHFNPEIENILQKVKNKKFVLSDDIEDMYGDVISSDHLIVEPDEEYEYGILKIKTFLSNDLGVAYLIHLKGLNIYYGGDLASWLWPNIPEKAKEETENFFRSVLNQLSDLTIHIGFSNVDFRLPNLGGAKEFVETVKPKYFIPMHLFEDPSKLDEFSKDLSLDDTIIFKYKKPGDSLEVSF